MGNLFDYTEPKVSPDNTCLFPGCHRLKYSNFNYCGNTYDKYKHRIFVSLMLSYTLSLIIMCTVWSLSFTVWSDETCEIYGVSQNEMAPKFIATHIKFK